MYLANHGAQGLLAFPGSHFLFANDLNKAFKEMHEKGMYGEMVIYMEGSESGSIFEGLLDEKLGILAITGTGALETSFATFCYPNDKVNGEHLGICMGDMFSANWMEDSDKSDPKIETL